MILQKSKRVGAISKKVIQKMQDKLRHKTKEIAVIPCYPLHLNRGGVATYMRECYSEPVTRNSVGRTGKAIPIATVRSVEVLRVTFKHIHSAN